MLRRLSGLLLAALPLAVFCLAAPGTAAADTPTPQAPTPTPAVDTALKAQGDEALAAAQASAQAGEAGKTLEKLKAAR